VVSREYKLTSRPFGRGVFLYLFLNHIRGEAMKSIRFCEEKSEDLRWLTITTLLLAIGVILRMVSPNIGGISLNWNIVMYTLAIMLCRPTPKQGLGIGFVSGLVATMSSKAALPYANLVSDPLAGLVCATLASKYLLDFKIRKVSLEPVLLVFLTTFVSGGSFVLITKVILSLPMQVFLYAMMPAVLLVALLGSIAGQILYRPANKIFNATANVSAENKYSLKDIQMRVEKGAFVVITGVNGAGKTSLLQTIAGANMNYFDDVYNSTIHINGIDVLQTKRGELKKRIGMVMADYEGQLVTECVSDEIDFSLENAGLSIEKILQRRDDVLQMVGLKDMAGKKIAVLSGGQKQRLAIAVMLALHAEILILDEPVAAIDPEGAAEIYHLLQKIRESYHTTIIVSEHDLKYVMPYATQMIVMEDGRMKKAGSIKECLKYMYDENIYPEAIPLKTKIYLKLGESLC